MKTLKNTFFFIFVTIFLMSCGGGEGADVNTVTDSTSTEVSTTGTTSTNVSTASVEDASGKITDAIVKQACDCQEGARQKDKSIDFPKVIECMGGKNKIQFVAELLGAAASEKDRADAERSLTDKMNLKCPRNK